MTPTATIVVDLGFGDAGKGTLTDWLARRTGAGLAVRFNGGAQAGHNVVTPDRRTHTFAQFGAGSFVPGVRTHLSRFMIVHPGGLLREAEALGGLGLDDAWERLTISGEALLITPFLQAAGRLRELLRGGARHGSCGIGVGEAMQHSLRYPADAVRLADLADEPRLLRKLQRQQACLWEELARPSRGEAELQVLESATAGRDFVETARPLLQRLHDGPLPNGESIVFEGAQGVLLDEWRGFHPYTTWSTCTFDNALQLLQGWDGPVKRLGVVRSYATRHGAGPFPTEDAALQLPEPHNHHGPWQGGFRQGWLDLVLLRYALEVCGGVDGLAVTHLDRVRPDWKMAVAYEGTARLEPGPFQDLDYQAALTQQLLEARPIYAPCRSVVDELQQRLDVPVWVESHGPTCEDKRELSSAAVSRVRLASNCVG